MTKKNHIIPITFNGKPYGAIVENPTFLMKVYCALNNWFNK